MMLRRAKNCNGSGDALKTLLGSVVAKLLGFDFGFRRASQICIGYLVYRTVCAICGTLGKLDFACGSHSKTAPL